RHQVTWLNSGAPRHLARQWAPSHQARQWALSQLARQRAPGHQVLDCLARQRAHRVTRYDSGHWVTRDQVIWLASGHRVIWQGSVGTGHQALDRLARQRASGHQASGHLARQRAPASHLARQWAPRSPGTTAGSESIGTTADTGSGTGSSGSTAGIESL
ncbi:unnamed protein product, partial [Staurois parvus]